MKIIILRILLKDNATLFFVYVYDISMLVDCFGGNRSMQPKSEGFDSVCVEYTRSVCRLI